MSAGSAPVQEFQVHCQACGVQAPTMLLTFRQNVGMFVARQSESRSGEFCRPCARAIFKSYTLTTFFLGWWGVISFFMTPVFLVSNIWQYLRAMSLQDPVMRPNGPPTEFSQGLSKGKLLYGVAVWVVVLGYLAYNNVAFVEKHLPFLNRSLHSGEITDDNDAEYTHLQINKDMAVLNAEVKSEHWADWRKEFADRQAAMDDLERNNRKLQAVGAKERAEGLDKKDTCESDALGQYLPALDDYTKAGVAMFALMKKTESPTPADEAAFHDLDLKQADAIRRINAFVDHRDVTGCGEQK